jgi:FlaA1/EpsC-like NDP-sugar epimerase
MIKRIINHYSKQFVPKWAVLFFDVVTIASTFVLAYLIRFDFHFVVKESPIPAINILVASLVYLIFFLLIRSYSGIIRHTGLSDAFRIIKASSSAFGILLIVNLIISIVVVGDLYTVSYSILIIHFLLSIFFLVGSRVFIKLLFTQISRQYSKEKLPVLIYGAGSAGMLTKNALVKDRVSRFDIVAFIDDNPSKVSKRLEDIPVVTSEKAFQSSYLESNGIQQLIIAIPNIELEKKKKIIELGLEYSLKVKVVPAIDLWINGQLSSQQLRKVKIEELLERETIELDSKNISKELRNKTVMITGGAGSIGSEIVRQILNYSPRRLVIVDQAESPIYELQFEINTTEAYQKYLNRIEYVVASVKDTFRMNGIFDTFKPDIIYHAAAYKHVPLMEQNPYEALCVNVFGTKVIADLSVKYEVEKFVMVSTDKAVNPTNVMGASKRIAEIYIQSISNKKTKFITTRFGNVLGSNGSVVPLFRKQIESGGPITITHKDITRYFMTIPEACNLVLEAGSMGKGADIFIFDMGKSVRIYDMARKMIKLHGFTPDEEIKIVETGLRNGEKLYEELLNVKENTLPTHHPKIKRASVVEMEYKQIEQLINELSETVLDKDDFKLVSKMKQIVPEYLSKNSVYEMLDNNDY